MAPNGINYVRASAPVRGSSPPIASSLYYSSLIISYRILLQGYTRSHDRSLEAHLPAKFFLAKLFFLAPTLYSIQYTVPVYNLTFVASYDFTLRRRTERAFPSPEFSVFDTTDAPTLRETFDAASQFLINNLSDFSLFSGVMLVNWTIIDVEM